MISFNTFLSDITICTVLPVNSRIPKDLGPVPQKVVKFNPGLSQISSKVFLSKNVSLELTKYCCVFNPRFSDDNILLLAIQRKVKYKKGTKFYSWISANWPFRNWGQGMSFSFGCTGPLVHHGEQGRCTGESTLLQLMLLGFSSWLQCLMWAEFAVGSLPSPGRFSPGTPVSPSPQKPKLSNFNLI